MKFRLRFLVVFFVFYCSSHAHSEPVAYESLELLGRSRAPGLVAILDAAEWSWLRDKKVLLLGTSTTDAAPFDMASNQYQYEGLTADYAQLISKLLNIKVEVRLYESRTKALEALKRGELDLLSSAGAFEAADKDLVVSRAYFEDQPVLVAPRAMAGSLKANLEGARLALSDHYLDPSSVKENYPMAIPFFYPSALDAISAVIFGKADAYIGGAITSNYIINRNLLNELHIEDFAKFEFANIGFALRSDNHQLLRIINRALKAIPSTESMAIMRRWGGGSITVNSREHLDLSLKERQWLHGHPQLRVAIVGENPPISFFDQGNEFKGVAADLLEKISHYTGLKFELVRGGSKNDLVGLLQAGKADLIIELSQNASRENELRFTRPYFTDPFVLVSRSGSTEVNSLSQMAGKRLAISVRNSQREYISQYYPKVVLVDTENTLDAMKLVAQGKTDAAVNTMSNARYLLAGEYKNRLQLVSTVGSRPALQGIAVKRSSLELYSILDKVLMSIPPEELDELTSRGRGEVMVDRSIARAYQKATFQGLSIAAILSLVAVGWIFYLRRLIQKRDIAEQALNEQMEFMRVLINGLPHPIYVRDRQARMLLCNSRYLELAGRSLEELIGTQPFEGMSIDSHYNLELERQYHEVMDGGQELLRDSELMLPNGRIITAYHWILPFRGSTGDVKGIIAGWIDITEREELLNQLKDAKQEAEKANQAKTTFLATMSHEIRTPMNAVMGMLELVMKKANQGILDRFSIEVASSAARGMLDLIGDILDVVQIESGRLTLAPERALFKDLVESVVRMFEGMARQKHLTLVLEFDERADRVVLIDPLRFKQVISNLLSNAVKFTVAGRILISVHVTPTEDRERLGIRLWVQDTGIGISKEDQQRLFQPFSQIAPGSQPTTGGSGLGLVISRKLCSMMQGALTLSSVPGLGTQAEVLLELPILAPLPASKPESVLTHPVRELKVLVVDDYPANRLLLSQQLSYLGHNVIDEQDGAHGLRTWRNYHFDVVITDCNMPVMSGYELAKAIRAEEMASANAPCLIVGFTANAQPEEIDRCLAAGMDDCMFKPISMMDLTVRLAKVTSVFKQTSVTDEVEQLSDGIDLSSLEQLTFGDQASINSLLKDLASSNEEDLLRLLKLFSQNDLVGLSDLAHRVKGGARIIKARRLIQCCEQVQANCGGLDVARLTEAVDALHQSMETLGGILAQIIGAPSP
ncbi:Hybrid sensory histidine kinase EvgS [Pseudomonas chlororaphis subsp. aureofaciens]|nr:Hybrid sensory histidine kinase EvgS [Pseudomonas chlororaphis subsp. aureofaciens]KAB0530318.1 transporter substrate-binding domain-containing protein [Pseudomonas chlororaphis subsp. aureofaciens]TSD31744.1 transporter substrate-binding domain-containing protein [Pseudomonas sp. ATCC 13985]SDT30542.1 two-component system, NarL family, sensor histidine kinase EvgS [Pseudomonas chlororaphis]SUD24138.1 sensor histidine kinase/response regulator [Pseudomonas chlororaphis]